MSDLRPSARPDRQARRPYPPTDDTDGIEFDGPLADPAQVERFADAWEAVAGGTPLADVLAEVSNDAELAALVRLAATASELMPATVGAPTRARQAEALRAFMATERPAVAEVVRTGMAATAARAGRTGRRAALRRPASAGGWWSRWTAGRPQLTLRLTAAALAIALGLGSSVVVSADDLPGDPLYGVKRAAESARLALTLDPGRRAAFHLELAEIRISEIRALINRGRNPSARIVEAMMVQLSSAASEAATARDGVLIAEVNAARTAAARSLNELVAQLPSGATNFLGDAILELSPAPPPGRPAGHLPLRSVRDAPTPTTGAATSTPTNVHGGSDEEPALPRSTDAASSGAATAGHPVSASTPTGGAPTSPAGDAPPPGGPSSPGGGAPPPDGGETAPTSAPPPPPTDAPPGPPDEAPTAENPFVKTREAALGTQPPKATRVPKSP